MEPKVSIIILNWNGKEDTEECLRSLEKLIYTNFGVIVVDNGSRDGSVTHLKSLFPKVTFICNKKNHGFAEGNNIGVTEALKQGAQYLLLLNNDTIVDPGVLHELIKTAETQQDIMIVSPKIYNYYEKNRIESAGFLMRQMQAKSRPIGYGEIDAGQYDQDRKISFASGCAMLIKAADITVEIFDPYYFAYCEDLDFCSRIQKQGRTIYYAAKAKIWHKVSKSTGGYKSPLSIYLFTKNRFRFVRNNLTLLQKVAFYAYMSVYAVAFISFNLLKKENHVLVKNFIKGLASVPVAYFSDKKFEFTPYYKVIGINARYLQRQITGIERYALELIKNLAVLDKKNKHVLFFNKHEHLLQVVNKLNFVNYVTAVPTQFRLLRIFWEQFWLAHEIKKNKVDIFHGPSFLAPLIKKCKYVITIHDLSFFKYPESFTLENKLYFKFFLSRSINTADMIIADSASTKKDIQFYFGVPSERIAVIYLGVDEKYQKIQDDTVLSTVKKKYSLPDKFIMFTGVLSPRKNLETTLVAFAALKKKGYPHKFVIVGRKGWLYSTIFEKIKVLNLQNEVIFTDYVLEADLPAFYNLADVFVLASLYEGFGLPILEAMACGCPVVTSNRSSMPEVAGDAALLVDPLKIEEISGSIEKMIKDKELRAASIAKGFEQAKKFTWNKTAEKTLDVYNTLTRQ